MTVGDWKATIVPGLLFGLVAYATYDLTNQATLRAWPWELTPVDLAWGAGATAIAASIAAAAPLRFAP